MFFQSIRFVALLSLTGCYATLLAHESNAEQRPARPNIVIIVADDLGWADVGYHDSPFPTPHIDKLCETGVELDRFYVAPMCTQTRVGLLTGRYWSRFGNTAPTNERVLPWKTPTLASLLQASGYQTAITGKWHLGSKPEWGPRQFGFEHSHGALAGGVNPWSHLYKPGPYSRTWHRNDELADENGHVTDLITNEAVRLIREEFDERPFFLYVPYTAVHTPFDEPEEYLKRCEHIDAGRRQYAASCVHMDDGVGKIVEALEQSGQRDNTLVVFFSDNGGANGDDSARYPDTKPTTTVQGLNHPLRGWKTQVYEGGVRVPAVVNWPGRLEPGKVTQPLHVTDWLPTIASLTGLELSGELKLDGRNIWPVLGGDADATDLADRVIYTVGVHGRDAALHRGEWKLITRPGQSGKAQLFRLSEDPHEKNDVASEHPEVVREMLKLLTAEAASDNDALPKADNS